MPNVKNLEKVKAALGVEAAFNMDHWLIQKHTHVHTHVREGYKGCGTVACIGGTAEMLMKKESYVPKDTSGYSAVFSGAAEREVAEWLGVPYEQAKALFYPDDSGNSWSEITIEQAIQAIDNVIDYGRPKWAEVVGQEEKS